MKQAVSFDPAIPYLEIEKPKMCIYGLSTGSLRVKKSHISPKGNMNKILLDWRWTDPLPIYCWLITHPEGNILVDTGENADVTKRNYFSCDSGNGLVNRWILRFQLDESQEIGMRLQALEVSIDAISRLVLTHLHVDHTDGIAYFPKADILVGKTEWQNPFGAVPCLWPKWFKPKLIEHQTKRLDFPFPAYPITKDGVVWAVSTPGHTYGHQSVLVKTKDFDVLLAGDISFNQQQLVDQEVPGINIDKAASRDTIQKLLDYSKQRPLIYLPSHDPSSGQRLKRKDFL